MNNKWEVKVVDRFGNWCVDIYLVEKGYKVRLAHFKDGQIEMEEINDGAVDPKPTMTLPMELWNAIKDTMIDNKVRERGEVESELMATIRHLEDMRTLVFSTSSIKKLAEKK